ncbi:glycosyltransferase [Chloroflexota bacterium]
MIKKSLAPEKDNDLYIAYVSTFPPRQCGIATFTEDVVRVMDDMLAPAIKSRVIAMNYPGVPGYSYPDKVIFQINQDNQQDYIKIARRINRMPQVRLVNVQHEFGIYGGSMGAFLISFLKTLKKPVVITCHTVLPDPDKELLSTVRSLAENSNALIVMTNLSQKILAEEYGISPETIHVIPHGIHSRPFTSSRQSKRALGYSNKTVLSTFGMLSRGKGLEYVIDALPDVIKEYPNFVYLIVGATHPLVVEYEGESYRNSLIKKIYKLNLYDHVKLYNEYYPVNELLHFLNATDIYMSTSLDPNQAVSGTLSYALGMGRSVISTSFAQAQEIITDEVGILVDFRNSREYTDAILCLLKDENLRTQLGQNAYFRTRNMIWPNIALNYARVFSAYAEDISEISNQKSLPEIKIDHIARLTDNFGIIQFAKFSRPDISSGYTLDDNARALVSLTLHYKKLGKSLNHPSRADYKRTLIKLIDTYLEFIDFVKSRDGIFLNYVNGNKKPNARMNNHNNLEDSEARAVYALANVSTTGILPKYIREKASAILNDRIKTGFSFNSPRAIATYIKMLHVLLKNKINVAGIDLGDELNNQCDRLVRQYEEASSPDWQWFENYLTYSNGALPEAVLLGYQITRNRRYLQVGRKTLDFLIEKSFINGILMPIGQDGWYHRGNKRFHFDQQPEEVKSMIYALKTCYSITRNKHYYELLHKAFYWFLGENSLNQVVYDRVTGGCYDGIGTETINLNQGAESTVSYLMARLAFE